MILKQTFLAIGMWGYKLLYNLVNCFFSKQEKVLVISNTRLEDNAIEMANYIARHYTLEVAIMLPEEQIKWAKMHLHPAVTCYKSPRYMALKWGDLKRVCSSRYLFFTYQFLVGKSTKNQYTINLWHGVGHKKIQHARAYDGIQLRTDYTIATSAMTQKMFGEFFENPPENVWISGLPRNDLLLNSQPHKTTLKKKYLPKLNAYTKIIIWMPTYRRKSGRSSQNEVRRGNVDGVFGYENFDVQQFNQLLQEQNSVCLIKAHHRVSKSVSLNQYSQLQFIDDEWIWQKPMQMYQLLACTDALITDYSSVMIDYSLLNQPIFCLADDVETFKQTQGLYFEVYEQWVPTKLFTNQQDFFTAVRRYLETGEDAFKTQRQKICRAYFQYPDAHSAQRIAEKVFGKNAQIEKRKEIGYENNMVNSASV